MEVLPQKLINLSLGLLPESSKVLRHLFRYLKIRKINRHIEERCIDGGQPTVEQRAP